MADFTYFTVVGDFLSIVGDTAADIDTNPDTIPIRGTIKFTPQLNNGDVLLARTLTPRPAAVLPAKVSATIDSDGQLKYNGQVGVKLLANTDILELDGDLYYQVEFISVRVGSETVTIKGFTFDQVCCGSPERDHVDVPLRYIVWCRIKHWLYR